MPWRRQDLGWCSWSFPAEEIGTPGHGVAARRLSGKRCSRGFAGERSGTRFASQEGIAVIPGTTGDQTMHAARRLIRGVTGVAVATLATVVATPAAVAQSRLSSADSVFLIEAAQNGQAEIQAGRMAQEKTQNSEVKTFAQRMVDEH